MVAVRIEWMRQHALGAWSLWELSTLLRSEHSNLTGRCRIARTCPQQDLIAYLVSATAILHLPQLGQTCSRPAVRLLQLASAEGPARDAGPRKLPHMRRAPQLYSFRSIRISLQIN